LIYVSEVYSYTKMNTEYDASLYLDPRTLGFVVIEGSESAIPPSVSCSDSNPIPVRKHI
jgi:hypothetical protein